MTKLLLAFIIISCLIPPVEPILAQGFIDNHDGLYQAYGGRIDNGPLLGPGATYLGPIKPNAYGLGINADATGRPFQWQPEGLTHSVPDATLKVTPNAYGMAVHADQHGRIVQPMCPFGQSC